MKVDPGAHTGDRRPVLTPEMLEDADSAVLTVSEAETGIDIGDRVAARLSFKEFPEVDHWLTFTGIKTLIKYFGDDDDDWVGERVPLIRVRVNNPRTGEKVVKLHVADTEDWGAILAEANKKTRKAKDTGRGRKK